MDSRFRKVNKIIDEEFKNTSLGGRLDDKTNDPTYFVDGNTETTWREYLFYSLRHTFDLMGNVDVKYLPLVAKLAFSDEVGFEKRDDNGADVAKLIKIVGMVKKDDELSHTLKDIPNLTFAQVVEITEPQIQIIDDDDTRKSDDVDETDDYDIIEVPDFKTANYYGNHSCSESKLCYTQGESTWKNFKGNKEQNRCYLCLRKGWKNISEQATEGNPYDLYGTSMIFVFIDPEGDIAYSNTRWNHRNTGKYDGSVDHAFSKDRLAKTVGRKFSKIFKPYSKEELREKGYIEFDEVPELLEKGVNPEDIFNEIGDFNEGFAFVYLNNKYNFINRNNEIISNTWYDNAFNFYNGFAKVCINNKGWSYLKPDGTYIGNTWYDVAFSFSNGFAKVYIENKGWNYLKPDGKLVGNTWYRDYTELKAELLIKKIESQTLVNSPFLF